MRVEKERERKRIADEQSDKHTEGERKQERKTQFQEHKPEWKRKSVYMNKGNTSREAQGYSQYFVLTALCPHTHTHTWLRVSAFGFGVGSAGI